MEIQTVCVYCASSERTPSVYLEAAAGLGRALAQAGIAIVYGGSSLGSMGRLAAAALDAGGRVTGVLPRFMHERKRIMLELSDAVVALPGGCGTLEELLEAITWKRLGLYRGPVVLTNVNGFYDPCLQLLARCVEECFMDPKHAAMWLVAGGPEEVVPLLRSAPEWPEDARSFAALR